MRMGVLGPRTDWPTCAGLALLALREPSLLAQVSLVAVERPFRRPGYLVSDRMLRGRAHSGIRSLNTMHYELGDWFHTVPPGQSAVILSSQSISLALMLGMAWPRLVAFARWQYSSGRIGHLEGAGFSLLARLVDVHSVWKARPGTNGFRDQPQDSSSGEHFVAHGRPACEIEQR